LGGVYGAFVLNEPSRFLLVIIAPLFILLCLIGLSTKKFNEKLLLPIIRIYLSIVGILFCISSLLALKNAFFTNSISIIFWRIGLEPVTLILDRTPFLFWYAVISVGLIPAMVIRIIYANYSHKKIISRRNELQENCAS
jgi:hypothetical protein